MADPKKQYKVGGKVFDELEDGTLREVVKDVSIADAPSVSFKPPSIPLRIPGKAVIEAEKAPSIDPQAMIDALPTGFPGTPFYRSAPQNIKSDLTTMGSMAAAASGGGALPVIARSAMGAMLGNATGQGVDMLSNDKDFSLQEAAGEGIFDAAISAAFGGLGAITGAVKPFVKRAMKVGPRTAIYDALLQSSLFHTKNADGKIVDLLKPVDRAAVAAAPRVPMTVGMTTGKDLAEQVLTPDLSKIARQTASEENIKTLIPYLPKTTSGAAGMAGMSQANATRKALREVEDQAYDIVKGIAKQHTKTIPVKTKVTKSPILDNRGRPITEMTNSVKVEGPINLGEVKTFAKQSMKELDEAVKLVSESPVLSTKFKMLQKALKKFSTEDVASYEQVRNAQASINKILRDKDNGLLPDNTSRILSDLKKKIDTDVLASMEMDWPAGSATAYKNAMESTMTRTDVLTKGVNRAFRRGKEVPEDFFNTAFNSATEARQAKQVAGRDRTAKEFVRKFTDKFWNKPEARFDGATALAEWGKTNNSEVAKELLTSKQRQGIKQFFHRAALIQGNPSNIGVMAMDMQQANAGIGAVKDLAGAVGNPAKLFSSSLLKLTAIMGGREFSEKVLLNPARAREAARLLTLRPGRAGATSEARKFILGGNLGEVLLRADNGEEVLYDTETGEATKVN